MGKISRIFFCTLLPLFSLAQQEDLVVLPTKNQSLLKSAQLPLISLKALPFFDDFAYPYTKPLASLWADDDAFVNTAFAKNMPTIGVVSLDAMDASGALHESVGITPSISDYLTSQPINLKTYEPIYFSDKLYKKGAGTFSLLDDTYYMYDSEKNTYTSVSQRLAYSAGDTIYVKSGDVYLVANDSLYDEKNEYIKGSYSYENQYITYAIKDSLALSFSYQAGGYVDVPELGDSLVLEFYAPYDTAGLFINEITATGIELYNALDSAVSLQGYYLLFAPLATVLQKDSLQYFALPEEKILPYQHMVYTPEQFGLKSFAKAYAYLYSPDTLLVDSVSLNYALTNDAVYARMTDGNPTWSYTGEATLGYCNPSWERVWATSNPTGDAFVSVYLPLLRQKYLVKGFRFRFKNYTSLSNDESHARNEDFWHLDMILLDAHRTVDVQQVADVAFAKEITPLYTKYRAMPLSHFAQVSYNDFRMTIPATFTNFDKEYRKLKFYFSVKKKHTGDVLTYSTYETDMPPQITVTERDILTDFDVDFYDFIAQDTANYKKGEYEFQYYYNDINNALNSQYRWNDTCRTLLTLENYYAYDDGTPEAGYGLRDAPMGKVAFKYDILQPDTLTSVAMYFNPTMESATTFNLCIWADNNGVPGELLYYATSEEQQYEDGLYQFVRYPINPENIVSGAENLIVGKTFFVGWEQPNDVLLNVGMDLNTELHNTLYYNVGFQWELSSQTGALLIRPTFRDSDNNTSIAQPNNSISIYPTIARSFIQVEPSSQVASVCLYTMQGLKLTESTSSILSVESLPSAWYVAVITTIDGRKEISKFFVAPQK